MIDREVHGDVTVLRLNHGKANVMDLELCRAAVRHLEEEKEGPAKAVVLTGAGRSFSAGVDLLRILEGGAEYVQEFVPALVGAAHGVFSFPKPLVAAINGHAIAGGCLIACGADVRLMARDSGGIGVPELLVGVPFPAAALEILRFTTPSADAQRLVYSGRILDPDRAAKVGMVDEVVDADELLQRAIAAAERLAAVPAVSFAMTKKALRQPAFDRLERAGEAMDTEVTDAWSRPEIHAVIRSYVERTFKKP